MTSIWPNNKRIEIIGVTGPFNSGKTLFGLLIDPKSTVYYDFEKSGSAYDGIGATMRNVPDELLQKFPNGYTPLQAFQYWRTDIAKLKPGAFSVAMVDPASDIEDGMTEWVKSRYSEYGFKSEDAFAATGGIFWNRVRSEWKKLLVDLASKVQTFVFTTHLKQVWKGGKPTDKFVPKGKSTLLELATLYLHLDRSPDKNGVVSETPSATVLKSRLATFKQGPSGVIVQPVLPPRLAVCTPDAIRKYIVSPPDYDKLADSEKVVEKEMTNEEKLELARETAEAQSAAATATLAVESLRAKQEEARAIARSRLRPNSDQAIQTAAAQAEARNPSPALEISEEEEQYLLSLADAKGVTQRVIAGVKKALDKRSINYQETDPVVRLLTRDEYALFATHLSN